MKINYKDLSLFLSDAGLSLKPDELHGLICGHICALSDASPEPVWQGVCVFLNDSETFRDDAHRHETLNNDQLKKLVIALVQVYRHSLADLDLGFEPLMPDAVTVDYQLLALKRWCGGFLHGFACLDKPAWDQQLSADVKEAISDLTEITRLDELPALTAEHDSEDSFASFDHEEDVNALESALLELTEYLKTAVLLIFTELQMKPLAASESIEAPTIH